MPKLVSPWAASLLLRLAKYELAENRGARFLKLAEEARGRITHISAEDASVALQKRVLVIDVREKDEFSRGHIPRAIHLARGTLEIDIERHAPSLDAEIVTTVAMAIARLWPRRACSGWVMLMCGRSRAGFRPGSMPDSRPGGAASRSRNK